MLWTQKLTEDHSLAHMELYVFITHLLRRFELVLAGTTERDMVWDDMVIPQFSTAAPPPDFELVIDPRVLDPDTMG